MGLKREEILKIFKDTEALQYPWHAETLCREIADHFKDERIDVVVSPAVGGIVFGQEVARLLGVRAIFAERVDGQMALRRGFTISPGKWVLVAEDGTTTGGSVKEVMEVVRQAGGKITAVTSLVDRSGGKAQFGVPYFSLFQMEVKNYDPKECPLCRAGSTAVKPGSRGLK